MAGSGGWEGRGGWELLFGGDRVLVLQDEKVSETLCTWLTRLYHTLQMVKRVHLMLCVSTTIKTKSGRLLGGSELVGKKGWCVGVGTGSELSGGGGKRDACWVKFQGGVWTRAEPNQAISGLCKFVEQSWGQTRFDEYRGQAGKSHGDEM